MVKQLVLWDEKTMKTIWLFENKRGKKETWEFRSIAERVQVDPNRTRNATGLVPTPVSPVSSVSFGDLDQVRKK